MLLKKCMVFVNNNLLRNNCTAVLDQCFVDLLVQIYSHSTTAKDIYIYIYI